MAMMNRRTSETAILSASTSTTIPQHSPLRVSLWNRQRGSLPLKKRRFLDLLNEDLPRLDSSSLSDGASSFKLQPFPELNNHSSNPLLALVAAASVSAEPPQPSSLFSSSSSAQPPSCISNVDYSSTSQQYHSLHPPSKIIHEEEERQKEHYLVTPEQQQHNEEASSKARQRVHHPPLSNPLPGGCHGRTSRNNSYCRRQPCYNGSKYCKLHYQQYIVAGTRSPNLDLTTNVVETEQQPTVIQQTPPPSQQFQDKRFTGFGDETRCQATTTRGRACAYVSVNDTKYCHLHADYDTNPPPRRGGLNPSSKAKEECSNTMHPAIMSPQKSNTSPPPSVTSEESCASTSSSATTTEAPTATSTKKSKVVVNSPHPLLSSISSDQWFDKLVLISTGPLINHTGRVVKWGNGWVTVRTSTGGKGAAQVEGLLHNRRSVELLLLPQDGDSDIDTKPKEETKQKQEWKGEDSVSEKKQTNTEEQATTEESDELHRCVSIETDAPTPVVESSTDAEKCEGKEDSAPETAIPVVEMGDVSSKSTATVEVKEEPVVIALDEAQAATFNPEEKRQKDLQADPTAVKHKQAPKFSLGTASTEPQLVTPNSPRKVAHLEGDKDGIPLVDCLVAAQEGRRKFNMDLLFGTAALERSRRTVHKPTRYEDTAMLERKRSRMNGSTDSDSDCFSPTKRKRMDSPRCTK